MSFKAVHKPEENHEAWLMTYADFITLMASFFVLIISISEPKTEKMEAVIQGVSSGFTQDMIEMPFKKLYQDFQLIIEDNAVELQVATEYTDDGLQLDIASSSVFAPGSAEIKPEGLQMMKELAISIQELSLEDYRVEVEGHTDDTPLPPNAGIYPSNWELSSARAARIVRFLIEQGMPPHRLVALGYGDTRPKVPNVDNNGKPIPENRELNRRVIVNIKRIL